MTLMTKSIADKMMREIDDMFYRSISTLTEPPEPQETLTQEKILEAVDEIRKLVPKPVPKIQFTDDRFFPQEHYADKVEFIPHHPAHKFVSKFLNSEADTATVMFDGREERPDGTCYQFEDVVFVPESFKEKFK